MNIIMISDFNLSQSGGGAQVSNDLIIKEGVRRGHDIVLHNYNGSPVNMLRDYDMLISSNLEAAYRENRSTLDFIVGHPNHVRLEHDSCLYLETQDRVNLFQSSRLNFFLSGFHLDYFKSMYGDMFGETKIVYDPIDVALFKPNPDTPKIYDVVYCGLIHELKGVGELIEFSDKNKHRMIDVFGWSSVGDELLFANHDNITFHGSIPHKEMPKLFQSCNSVFHNPVVNEPFCRMVAEAILCGVDDFIGTPEKIGSLLEYRKHGLDEFKTNCSNASIQFWEALEATL